MYSYHCHNTKHILVPLSQYKTCTRTAVTIQNLYSYHYHNTKLSQYKTCTRTTVTVQNMYSHHCHSTKHVLVPLSQYKTCTHTTVTVQNMYEYHCHNTKHVRVPLSQYKTYTYHCHSTKHVRLAPSHYKTFGRPRTTVAVRSAVWKALLWSIQTDFVAQHTSYSAPTRNCFPDDKAAGTCRWPLRLLAEFKNA